MEPPRNGPVPPAGRAGMNQAELGAALLEGQRQIVAAMRTQTAATQDNTEALDAFRTAIEDLGKMVAGMKVDLEKTVEEDDPPAAPPARGRGPG